MNHNENNNLPLVLVIVGPTAVGKSDLGLAIGQAFGGELISADSRQIYRHLDVGTAKPTIAERLVVPHHLVDIVAPDEDYSLAMFQADALHSIAGATARGRLPMLVGGTGLYVRAIVSGLRIPPVAPRPDLRAALEARAASLGGAVLHKQLAALDPDSAARLDPRNLRRVIRALEVCLVTGQPMSTLQRREPARYRFLKIGLTCPREQLYRRIDARVERQVANGLIEETERAFAAGYGPDLPAMSGLGHKQMGLYLLGRLTRVQAIEMDKGDTHRFARQQYNWFRLSDPTICWLDVAEGWSRVVSAAKYLVERSLTPRRLSHSGQYRILAAEEVEIDQ